MQKRNSDGFHPQIILSLSKLCGRVFSVFQRHLESTISLCLSVCLQVWTIR